MAFIGPSGKALVSAQSAAQVVSALGLTLPATTITQTYSTASATNPNVTTTSPSNTIVLTATAIAGKTASLTLLDSGTADAAAVADSLNQAQKDLGTAHNTLRTEVAAAVADILAVKKLLNSIIDALQTCGILA